MNLPVTVRKQKDGSFLRNSEIYIENVNKKIANSIISGYYKGIEGDNRNAVLVVVYE